MERTISPQIIRTLNEMLEEERAAVEAVIGLSSMATDPSEREMLQRIGGDEVWACTGLRDRIEAHGGVPSMHISDFANYVLSLEYFPERLRTFGRHQRLIMERISTLLAQRGLDPDTKEFLEAMKVQHETDITWCETRATVFEATRYNGEAPPPRPTIPQNTPQNNQQGTLPGAAARPRLPIRQPQQSLPPTSSVPSIPVLPPQVISTQPPAAPTPAQQQQSTPTPAQQNAPTPAQQQQSTPLPVAPTPAPIVPPATPPPVSTPVAKKPPVAAEPATPPAAPTEEAAPAEPPTPRVRRTRRRVEPDADTSAKNGASV